MANIPATSGKARWEKTVNGRLDRTGQAMRMDQRACLHGAVSAKAGWPSGYLT